MDRIQFLERKLFLKIQASKLLHQEICDLEREISQLRKKGSEDPDGRK